MCATGYDVRWPFLPADIFPAGDGDQLDLRIFPRGHEGLYFVGLIQPNGGIWALADLQAQLIAKYLRAKQEATNSDAAASSPFAALTQRISNIDKSQLTGGLNYAQSKRHDFEVEYFTYRRTLENCSASKPAEEPVGNLSATASRCEM